MKTEMQAKFLMHLNKKKQDEGFTLIELLVVIIIIGILAAIALPSFLSQANKAKQSEAKEYVGSMNRGQQAYYLEQNTFTTAISTLGLGIKSQTANYMYSIASGGLTTGAVNQAQLVAPTAPLKAYVGIVSVGQTDPNTKEAATFGVLCEGVTTGLAGGPKGTETAANFAATTNAPDCDNVKYTQVK